VTAQLRQPNRIIICEHIRKSGTSLSFDEIYQLYPVGSRQGYALRQALASMLSEGKLIERDGKYSLAPEIAAWLEDRAETEAKKVRPDVVPPRTPPVFRPLSAKHIPSTQGTRPGCDAREVHFKTVGVDDQYRRLEA